MTSGSRSAQIVLYQVGTFPLVIGPTIVITTQEMVHTITVVLKCCTISYSIILWKMHSSRTHTVRSSSCLGGGSARGLSAQGGVCPGGCLLGGVFQHALRQTPPPRGQNS